MTAPGPDLPPTYPEKGSAVPTPTGPDDSIYCRTCRRALSVGLDPATGNISYRHSAAAIMAGLADHPTAPVPLAQLGEPIMECDVCSDTTVLWVYLCDEQVTHSNVITREVVSHSDYRDRHHAAHARRTDTETALTSTWGQRWAVCQPCADAIEARDLLALIARATAVLPPKLLRGRKLITVRGQLHTHYSILLDTLRPGRTPAPGASTDEACDANREDHR